MTRRLQGIHRASPARQRMAVAAVLWIGGISASCSSLYAQAAPQDLRAQPPAAAPAPAPSPTLTLSQALALARQNNRQIRIAGLQVEAAQQRTAAARTGLLPKITLQALGGQLVDTVSAHFPAGVLGTVNGSP